LAWLVFWPAPLALLVSTRPKSERPKWYAAVGTVVVFAAVAAALSGSPKSIKVAAANTTSTERQPSTSTTTVAPATTTTLRDDPDGTNGGGVPGSPEGRADGDHPDYGLTPGAVFPGVTTTQICVSRYSASVREVPSSLKERVFAAYGINAAARSGYVIDHLIALELGGSNDIKNLWPQPTGGGSDKDAIENKLHGLLCNNKLSLSDAQAAVTHWDVWVDPTATTTTRYVPPPTTVYVPPPTVYVPPPTPDCTPGYDPCIPPGSDVDCAGGTGNGPRYISGPLTVTGSDPYGLDTDHDGIGCE
jgi:hypothetical protein